MRLTSDDLAILLAKPGYTIGHAATHPALAPRLPHAKPERDAGEESLASYADEEGGGARIIVRITRCGSRILDADNAAGGTKQILDQLRYFGLIPEDNPQAIRLEVRQRKVKRAETGTIIDLIYPQNLFDKWPKLSENRPTVKGNAPPG